MAKPRPPESTEERFFRILDTLAAKGVTPYQAASLALQLVQLLGQGENVRERLREAAAARALPPVTPCPPAP